jgi:glutamate-1-semialdehyde aminotransferase
VKSWDERAKAAIAQGCLTFSKRSDQYIEGVSPTHCTGIAIGHPGFHTDHGSYFDFVCGLGSNLVSFRNNFSIPSVKEVELAERIKALFPCIDKLKLLKSGTAATDAAIRYARAHTQKALVWGVGYHGSSDTWISAEDPGVGTFYQFYQKFPDLEALIGNLELLDADSDLLAAVIIEPVQLDFDVKDSLQKVRDLCTKTGAVLIFDEVITGFRVPKYSVANYYGIQPDITCLGKALGDGYPISVMGGRGDIMDTEGVFISNTHNGSLEGISAALETLDFLTEAKIQDLWNRGERFQRAFNAFCPKVQIVGYPTRGELRGDDLPKALFMQEMAKRGYFWGRAWFMHHLFTEDFLNRTLEVAREVFASIESGSAKLEGLMPRPAFVRNR